MSVAHAVAHGAFGRALSLRVDRPMAPHAHREGHLIFHVRGPPACVVIDGKPLPLTPADATAISPWQPHFFSPIDRRLQPTLALVLYIRPGWFADASHTAFEILRFGRPAVEMSDHITRLASETARLLGAHGGDGSFEGTGSVPSPRRLSISNLAVDQRGRQAGCPVARSCAISACGARSTCSARGSENPSTLPRFRGVRAFRARISSNRFASRWGCLPRFSATPCVWNAPSSDWPRRGDGFRDRPRPRICDPGQLLAVLHRERRCTAERRIAAAWRARTRERMPHRTQRSDVRAKEKTLGQDRSETPI